MFDFENEKNNYNDDDDDFFNNYDVEMKEIDDLYNECETLYNENKIKKEKENDIYMVYIMFSVVSYMLIIGSCIKDTLKHYYINTLFPKPIEIYIDKQDNVNMLD